MITRRTITAAAWMTPVIAVATAAPAFAASMFECKTSRWCKSQNKQNSDRWDFKFWPGCVNGNVTTVLINNKAATFVPATSTRGSYWVLLKQPHSYTFSVVVRDGFGQVGFNRTVDVRDSSCGS